MFHQLREQIRIALRSIAPFVTKITVIVRQNFPADDGVFTSTSTGFKQCLVNPFPSRSRGKNSRFYAAGLESVRHRLRHQPCSVSMDLPVLLTDVVTSLVNVATRSVDGGGRHFLGSGQQVYEFQSHRAWHSAF